MKWDYIYISQVTIEEYRHYFSYMDFKKQNRVMAYKKEDDKLRTVAGEMLVRNMLSSYCHIPKGKIVIKIDDKGKPYAVGCVEFNISHSEGMVVCAISDNPIGIDVEKIRPIDTSILCRLCTDIDLIYIFGNETTINNIPKNLDEQQLHKFYEVWTAKEAYFKCVGTGIKNLKSISMDELTKIRKMFQIEDYIITVIES